MKKVLAATLMLLLASPVYLWAMAPSPPDPPETGYGSSQFYITDSYTEYEMGDSGDGERVWWYVPEVLKNGDSAPVVIFLHGFLMVAPDIYMGHIEHLCSQGYIVIFPQFNKGGISGVLQDMMLNADQNDFLTRAIDATNLALSQLGDIAETDDMVLYGHSVGGLMALCWAGFDGPAVQRVVLASPCLDNTEAMPSFVSGMMEGLITNLDYEALAPATQCPVTILWGNDDALATAAQMESVIGALPSASSIRLYTAFSDDHGDPEIIADHMACAQDDGWMPSLLMDMFGGDCEEDSLDYRYFYAGLDQALDGLIDMTFDMGAWSDGEPVLPIIEGLP
ncbi:Alpha/beta hydrolase family protein [Desulfatibacillum alkenivorans DSM 16219]|jgi:pimeloyl-ACP methyl ester carboxylesterase|uniref:Alpha/beta hydrolase family protein n=1 Tax=Desulfatibacillum alkenivorans DSM 16219 TaxID=1121393 RepID=A0A1M6YGM8_9BACT|nr:alpha/beta hydrolase [Desulfatibacillum alkenivorans]SHL17273.1 Alpha/beta hydrolase family protein [Desulfatibacillum alkenivorans DSM 16219]